MFGPFSSGDEAIKQFKSKFKDKTKNDCKLKNNFFVFCIFKFVQGINVISLQK
jgi:hypothetical protein